MRSPVSAALPPAMTLAAFLVLGLLSEAGSTSEVITLAFDQSKSFDCYHESRLLEHYCFADVIGGRMTGRDLDGDGMLTLVVGSEHNEVRALSFSLSYQYADESGRTGSATLLSFGEEDLRSEPPGSFFRLAIPAEGDSAGIASMAAAEVEFDLSWWGMYTDQEAGAWYINDYRIPVEHTAEWAVRVMGL